jgi:AraC-like DNA-binding protein
MSRTRDTSSLEAAQRSGLRDGADAYEHVLGSAGGSELTALMRGGDHATVCAAIYQSPAYDLHVPALSVSRLSINLTRARVSGCLDGEKRRSFEADRYSLFLVPAGAAASWRKDSPSRHLTIYFHADALRRNEANDVGDPNASAFPLAQPVFNAYLPGTRQHVDQLVAELDHPSTLSAESLDSLARLLLVGLAVLALLVGLAVLALRLEHAAALLRHSSLPVVDIAYACGFANQQHLTTTVRRHLGTTPGRYRNLQGSEACS